MLLRVEEGQRQTEAVLAGVSVLVFVALALALPAGRRSTSRSPFVRAGVT